MTPNIFDRKSHDTVFRDRSTLLPEFVPDKLPGREIELNRLAEHFSILLDPLNTIAVNIAITGQPGIGKTTISKKVINDLKSYATQTNVNLDVFYVNCHSFRTKTSILRKITQDKFYIQGRGFSDEELMEMLATRLEREDLRLVLAIDEASMLKGSDILSFLSLNELFPSGISRLSTIIICRRNEWSLLLSPTLSGRIHDQLNLEGYGKKELTEILEYRKSLAFFADIIQQDVFNLIVDISARTKNARHGIEIMLRSGMAANASGSSQITAELVRSAKTEVYPELRSDVFLDLKKSELIAALAIGKVLESPSIVSTSINQSYEKFKELCNSHKIQSQSKASYRICVDTLEKVGIISHAVGAVDEGRGRRAKISLFDIPAQILVERVENVLKNMNFEED